MTSRIFVAAGLTNIVGVLVFSRAFAHSGLGEPDPGVFGRFGLAVIVLWGLAYLAAARRHAAVPALSAVFALEKAAYFGNWVAWWASKGDEVHGIWARDPMTAVFYAAYGPCDLAFGLFFAWTALRDYRGLGGADSAA